MKQGLSTLGGWSASIVRALEAQGLDGVGLAGRAGIDKATLLDPNARVPRLALTRLWEIAIEATGDPCFGLTAIRFITPTTFHALGYAVMASATLREALERVIRYRRLLGDVMELSLRGEGERVRFVIDVSRPPGAPFAAVDAFAAGLVRQARALRGDREFTPLAVSLRRPAPPTPSRFDQAFGCPVRFSQPESSIEWRREDLEAPLMAGNAELARQNEEVVARYLARLESASFANRVEHALLESLPDGAPSKDGVARKLGLSPSTLQRRLADEGVTFKELLNRARAAMAREYIADGTHSITEIAFLLGFADTATFSRAFKRWTGRSPRDFAAAARRGQGRGYVS